MRILSFLAILTCGAGAALAQDNSIAPVFPKPSYFRTTFWKPDTKVELQGPVRLNDYVVNGKLELSLRSYLDLVMANNTDIQVQRLSVETFRNNITRQYAIFDPVALASFNATRTKSPATDVLAGAATVQQLSQPAQFSYTQLLQTGQTLQVGYNGNLNMRFSQPLLRNRGGYVTRLPITIARSRLRATEFTLQDQVMRLVVTAENAYWDVIFQRENLQVQEQALALADQLYKRSKRELELGAISELDIYQPEANRATAEIAVTQARYRLAQAEDALRRQVAADLDPQVRNLPIVLTENIDTSAAARSIDREEAVHKALATRPDLKSQLETLVADDLSIRSTRNALLPDFSLAGVYQSQGRGGPFLQRQNISLEDGTRSTISTIVPGGFGDALDQLFGFGFPVYGFQLNLRFPIRDRRAQSDYADAIVAKRLDTLRQRALEQQIRLDVLNAVSQLEQSRASIDLAKVALDLAQKRADAEQKKYDLGTTTIYFVAAAQQDLTSSRSTLVNQIVQYRRNLLNLLQRTGELLADRGIAIQ
jgi:outer membrane protein TolC